MEGTKEFLELVAQHGLARGHLRGVFHIAIGRKVTKADGTPLAGGVTWRELAAILKTVKFDRDLVKELGADPETVAPRDREKFWYAAIALAQVDSQEARTQAERLAVKLERYGIRISGIAPLPTRQSSAPAAKEEEPTSKKPKPKKK
jgi:hypothetical protein